MGALRLTPHPLILLILALAAYRTWKLIADDVILRAPRSWLVGAKGGMSEPLWFTRPRLEEWLTCPWCAGFWVAVAVYGGWLWEPRWTLYMAVPLAISAVVGLIGHFTAG